MRFKAKLGACSTTTPKRGTSLDCTNESLKTGAQLRPCTTKCLKIVQMLDPHTEEQSKRRLPNSSVSLTLRPILGCRRVYRTRVDNNTPLSIERNGLQLHLAVRSSLETCVNDEIEFYENRRVFRLALTQLCKTEGVPVLNPGIDYDLCHTFAGVLQIGDIVITMNPATQQWPVGMVSGTYEHCPASTAPHFRSVDWLAELDSELLLSAFFTGYGSRAISDVTDHLDWVDVDAMVAVERVLGHPWGAPPWQTKVHSRRYPLLR
jgi:hypothetical protein